MRSTRRSEAYAGLVAIGLFALTVVTIGWFMPLYAKDLPLAVALRVWDVLFVYGDTTLFAVGLALLKMAEPRLLACATLEQLYEVLKTIGGAMHERDSEAAQRLLLLVMEGLMCSPLADFIATERERHRANLCRDSRSPSVRRLR